MITLQRQKQEDDKTKKHKKRRRGFDDIIEKLERESSYQTRIIHCDTKRHK